MEIVLNTRMRVTYQMRNIIENATDVLNAGKPSINWQER